MNFGVSLQGSRNPLRVSAGRMRGEPKSRRRGGRADIYLLATRRSFIHATSSVLEKITSLFPSR